MTKRQLIDEIVCINHTAQPGFLAQFDDGDLNAYLQHLRVMQVPRIQRAPSRYEKYFVSVSRGASVTAAVPSYSADADDGEDLDTGGDVQLACESDSPGGTEHVDAEEAQPAVVKTATQDAELWLY